MSHITCKRCGSNKHSRGYGIAYGPMGSYTVCDECDALLEFSLDSEGMTWETIAKLEAQIAARIEEDAKK